MQSIVDAAYRPIATDVLTYSVVCLLVGVAIMEWPRSKLHKFRRCLRTVVLIVLIQIYSVMRGTSLLSL